MLIGQQFALMTVSNAKRKACAEKPEDRGKSRVWKERANRARWKRRFGDTV